MKTVVEEEVIEDVTTLDCCANMHEGPGCFFFFGDLESSQTSQLVGQG
jgi:hypothetical protein